MIKKQFLKSKPACKVTFSVDKKQAKGAKEVSVVGNFNNWNKKEGKLKALKNGSFKESFNIPTNQEIEFKYVIDNEYVNELEADKYVWNDFAASENSVIMI